MEIGVHREQGPGYSQTDGTGLTGKSASSGNTADIDFPGRFGHLQRALGMVDKGFTRKIRAYRTAIYRKFALSRLKFYAGNRLFPSTGCSKVLLFHISLLYRFSFNASGFCA